jgi:hypothetical protein
MRQKQDRRKKVQSGNSQIAGQTGWVLIVFQVIGLDWG